MLALVQRCPDHCQPARSYFFEMPKNSLTGDQRLFAKSTMRLALHLISLCFQTEQNAAHFPLIFPGVIHAKLIDR